MTSQAIAGGGAPEGEGEEHPGGVGNAENQAGGPGRRSQAQAGIAFMTCSHSR